jgi:hypothetical protein
VKWIVGRGPASHSPNFGKEFLDSLVNGMEGAICRFDVSEVTEHGWALEPSVGTKELNIQVLFVSEYRKWKDG